MSGPTSVPASSGEPTGRLAYALRSMGLELVDQAAVHDQAAQRGAALSGGAGRREHDGAQAQGQVGTGRDDGGIVAAELEQRASEARGDPRPQRAAHRRCCRWR